MEALYHPVKAVVAMHETPRFGHANDISVLVSNEFDKSFDYYIGLTYIISLLGITLFVWICSLLTLKLLDWRVGCASGRPFQMRNPEDLEPVAQRIVKTRITFLFIGLLLIGSTLSSIFNSSRIAKAASLVNVESEAFVSAIEVPLHHSREILEMIESTKTEREFFLKSLESFCPAAMSDIELNSASKAVSESFEALGEFFESEMQEVADGFIGMTNFFQNTVSMQTSKDSTRPWLTRMFSLYIVLIFIVVALIMGVVLAGMPSDSPYYGRFTAIQTWFLYPLFLLLVLTSWATTSGVSIASIMISDFCYGGTTVPGGASQTFVNMMDGLKNSGKSNFAYDSMSHIVGGCNGENPLKFLNDYENRIQRAKTSNIEYIARVTQPDYNYEEMGPACIADEQEILESSVFLGTNLDLIMENIKDLKMELNCGAVGPFWNNGVEEAICREGATALLWTFYSLIVVSICGMALFSLRAARNDVEVTFSEKHEEFDEPWRNEGRANLSPRSASGKVVPFDSEMYKKTKHESEYFDETLDLEEENDYSEEDAYNDRY